MIDHAQDSIEAIWQDLRPWQKILGIMGIAVVVPIMWPFVAMSDWWFCRQNGVKYD